MAYPKLMHHPRFMPIPVNNAREEKMLRDVGWRLTPFKKPSMLARLMAFLSKRSSK